MLSVFGGLFIWLTFERKRTIGKAKPLIGDTLVGMTGEVWIAIEPFSPGSVRIEGEIWRARSKENHPGRDCSAGHWAGWNYPDRPKNGKTKETGNRS